MNARDLRAAVREVLYGYRFEAAAQRLAGLLADAPGAPRAAELLEQLAGGGPQVAAAGPVAGVGLANRSEGDGRP